MMDTIKPLTVAAFAAAAIVTVAASAVAGPFKPTPPLPCAGNKAGGFTLAQYIPYPRTCCRYEGGRRICYQC